MKIDNSTVEMNVIANSAAGTFVQSSNSTISASTDNATGYTLKIAATSSDNYQKLINSADSDTGTNSLTSIGEATTLEVFKSASSTAYNGKWGYLPSKYNSSANTSFLPAPTACNTEDELGACGDTLNITECANNTTNCPNATDTYTLAIGARIDSTTKLGSYSNTYNVFMVANAIAYTFIYDDNVVSNMPSDETGTSPTTTKAISSNIPTRDGYTFLGWCVGTITTTDGVDSCNGTTYTASSNYELDGTTGNTVRFGAMWRAPVTFDMAFAAAGKTKASGYYAMQDAEDSICAAVDTEQYGVLIDTRDSQTYTVAKLLDGKCWMTKNLNLAGGTALSYEDTDFESSYTLPTSWGWQTDGRLPESSVSGFTRNNYAYVYNSHNTACASNTPCYSYYSWDAATLGSGRSLNKDNTDAPYSICPKGWRLPITGSINSNGWKRGDYYALATAYGANLENGALDTTNNNFYNNAGPGTLANFVMGGLYYDDAFRYGGSSGYYATATSASSSSDIRALTFSSSSYAYVAVSHSRSAGMAVRCLFGS